MISLYIISSVIFCSILAAISGSGSLYAHNGIKIAIPIATHKITLDGIREGEEWSAASKFNFSSPTKEGDVSIYLQYDLTENSLSGAFFIPDKTQIKDYDQIAFLFDVNHSALSTINPDAQQIVFIRNGTSEYYIGNDRQGDLYELVGRATLNSNDSSRMHPPMILKSPFTKTDFITLSNTTSWQGEFKIYFREIPTKVMGFSISQVDDRTMQNKSDAYFVNYPKANINQAQIPSSWGDISFPQIDTYVKNVNNFCHNVVQHFSPDRVVVLCSSLNKPSIGEDETDNLVLVSGALANLINGTGISDKLDIFIKDSNGNPASEPQEYLIKPDANGTFTSKLETKGLKSGAYKIVVQPISKQYTGLVSASDLMVNPHTLTVQEFGAYIGIAATAIGFVAFLPQIRNYFNRNRQTRNMVKQLSEINMMYDRLYNEDSSGGQPQKASEFDKKKAVYDLRQKRDNALVLLQNNQISQEQYTLLDGKISEYTSKLVGDKSAP